MKKCLFIIQDAETGTFIEGANSLAEAKKIIAEFERQDEAEGIYTPNFYEIFDTGKSIII